MVHAGTALPPPDGEPTVLAPPGADCAQLAELMRARSAWGAPPTDPEDVRRQELRARLQRRIGERQSARRRLGEEDKVRDRRGRVVAVRRSATFGTSELASTGMLSDNPTLLRAVLALVREQPDAVNALLQGCGLTAEDCERHLTASDPAGTGAAMRQALDTIRAVQRRTADDDDNDDDAA